MVARKYFLERLVDYGVLAYKRLDRPEMMDVVETSKYKSGSSFCRL